MCRGSWRDSLHRPPENRAPTMTFCVSPNFVSEPSGGTFDTYDEAVAAAHAIVPDDAEVVYDVSWAPDLDSMDWVQVWPENQTDLTLDELREVDGLAWRTEHRKALVVHVPAGTYFVGDPCY